MQSAYERCRQKIVSLRRCTFFSCKREFARTQIANFSFGNDTSTVLQAKNVHSTSSNGIAVESKKRNGRMFADGAKEKSSRTFFHATRVDCQFFLAKKPLQKASAEINTKKTTHAVQQRGMWRSARKKEKNEICARV